jgi:hypothetical protein
MKKLLLALLLAPSFCYSMQKEKNEQEEAKMQDTGFLDLNLLEFRANAAWKARIPLTDALIPGIPEESEQRILTEITYMRRTAEQLGKEERAFKDGVLKNRLSEFSWFLQSFPSNPHETLFQARRDKEALLVHFANNIKQGKEVALSQMGQSALRRLIKQQYGSEEK